MVIKLSTRNGDKGKTLLLGGAVSKDSLLVHTIGCLDAFITSLDFCRLHSNTREKKRLEKIQDIIINLSIVLTLRKKMIIAKRSDITALEKEITKLEKAIPAKFVRFDTPLSCHLNEARVRCRELERFLVKYLDKKIISPTVFAYINRLSDYLFCLAHAANSSPSK